jgi:hypothetical protein
MATFTTLPFRVVHYLGFKVLPSHQPPFARTELATSWLGGCCATRLIIVFLTSIPNITGDPENNGKHQFFFLLASQKGNPRGCFLFVSSLIAIAQTTQKCAWMKLSDTQARVLTLISSPDTPSGFSSSFCHVNPYF